MLIASSNLMLFLHNFDALEVSAVFVIGIVDKSFFSLLIYLLIVLHIQEAKEFRVYTWSVSASAEICCSRH